MRSLIGRLITRRCASSSGLLAIPRPLAARSAMPSTLCVFCLVDTAVHSVALLITCMHSVVKMHMPPTLQVLVSTATTSRKYVVFRVSRTRPLECNSLLSCAAPQAGFHPDLSSPLCGTLARNFATTPTHNSVACSGTGCRLGAAGPPALPPRRHSSFATLTTTSLLPLTSLITSLSRESVDMSP